MPFRTARALLFTGAWTLAGLLVATASPILAATPGVSDTAITGVVSDETGAPVAGASVMLRGPATYATHTDATGHFALSHVPPARYTLSLRKPGYDAAIEPNIVAFSGEPISLTVRMTRRTFSSLRRIASIQVVGSRQINATAASEQIVTPQTFVDQGQPQMTRVLSQVPGEQISYPSTDANAAAPGAITVPNIRGAASYETASLIDGHPIAVGQYGDNVTTFLNTFMFGSVEVIKGPGADSPVDNNAIGGTTNFITKDPTSTPEVNLVAGIDSHGGTIANMSFSNTVGRLGFLFAYATFDEPSAINGYSVYYDPSGGLYNGLPLQGTTAKTNVGGTASRLTTNYSLLACCYRLQGELDNHAELAKLHYKLSSATNASLTFLGGQSATDKNANAGSLIASTFAPGPGYKGSLAPGPVLVAHNVNPGTYWGETDIEPIFQAQVSTTLGRDSFLARYYHAAITRFQFQGGQNPDVPDFNTVALYGTSSGSGSVNRTFSGTTTPVGYFDYSQEPQADRLSGASFEYDHPMGDDLLSLSANRVFAQSSDYTATPNFPGVYYSANLPPGTSQILTTYRANLHVYLNPKLLATLTDYYNTYRSTYPASCANNNCNTYAAAALGQGVAFDTLNDQHQDPRAALVYRPTAAASIRLSAGSAIAPPFMGLLNLVASPPTYSAQDGVAVESYSNGAIAPETAFGYDLGGDLRLRDNVTIVSGDAYLTNLYNRFFSQTSFTGQTCDTVKCQTGGSSDIPPGTPIVRQINGNVSNARFEGIELSVRHDPTVGFGFDLAGDLQRGYYYALPPYFYCVKPAAGCVQDTNINIIPGENINGVGVGSPINGQISYNANMRLPYSQGFAQLTYTTRGGLRAAVGATYFGYNNSLNEPAFAIASAALRVPLTPALSVQVTGDNLFNAYSGLMPIYGGGVAIPVAGSKAGTFASAATEGNVLGPATYRFMLIYRKAGAPQ